MKLRLSIVLITFVFSFSMTLKVHAKEELREEVFKVLAEAFQAQVSLSEEKRDLTEVHGILTPFFTKQAASIFLAENLHEENGKYFTLGSDFVLYYIPFFTFSKETKIKFEDDRLIVYEFFPTNNEGPVSYESHYQGILMVREQGQWKVSDFYYYVDPKQLFEIQSLQDPTEIETLKVSKDVHNLEMAFKIMFSTVKTFLGYSNKALISFMIGEGRGH